MSTFKTVAAAIKEIENWLRLATFLHEPLKDALLGLLHNTTNDPTYTGLPSVPADLYKTFFARRKQINNLVKKGILHKDQVDLLLPNDGNNQTFSDKFDVTLIALCIRSFLNLPAPLNGWNKDPLPTDKTKTASVKRALKWRNKVQHAVPKDIDNAELNKMWVEGTQIIQDLGSNYKTQQLRKISLDPKHEVVLKSLFTYMSKVKDDCSQHILQLDTQLQQIAKEIKYLKAQKTTNPQEKECKDSCLKEIIAYVENNLTEAQKKDLLKQMNINLQDAKDGSLANILSNIQWLSLKVNLDLLGRQDLTSYIQENTLITKGLNAASKALRSYYVTEFIRCLVDQPLSNSSNYYVPREDVYVELAVLEAVAFDEELSNSDRDSLMKQSHLTKTGIKMNEVLQPDDQLIFVRGVAGIGKSTWTNMFTLKWAKETLKQVTPIDFLFVFTCSEINAYGEEPVTLEKLLTDKYHEVFQYITLDDLSLVANRVLIVVDGLDELKNIYSLGDGARQASRNTSTATTNLDLVYNLIDPRGQHIKRHKSMAIGRPKACEFVKSKFTHVSKTKTIQICGFDETNVQTYIQKYFGEDGKGKIARVKKAIESSKNLKVMTSVPVFLWVICNVYSEDLITKPINTNTELYLYTCLVFLRNHLNGLPGRKYKQLSDIVGDQNILKLLYTLMILSVDTYMKNKVLFTEEDMKRVQCQVHLEETGFIVKYKRKGIKNQEIYHFNHLVLQEFLCGLFLCVTKQVSSYKDNRELNSCVPTILGIHRLLQENNNDLFIDLFTNLTKIHNDMSSFFAWIIRPLRSKRFEKFVLQKYLQIPPEMIDGDILTISATVQQLEFLSLFFEGGCVSNDPDAFKKVRILGGPFSAIDVRNILFFISQIDVRIDEIRLAGGFSPATSMLITEAKITDILLNHVADGTSGSSFYGDEKILKIVFNNNIIEELNISNHILEKSESFIIRGKVESENAKRFVLSLVEYAIENHKQIILYDGPIFKRSYFAKEIDFDQSKSFLLAVHNIKNEQFLKVVDNTTEVELSYTYLRHDYPIGHLQLS
ncbi:uncharacterized protein [Clytia hemisphaerica]|uniref:NACHT domain-containing protein n=1 Tax=Clytia hemisphaerica TaxID=252671 RepID=A0A7M5U857_9CNID